MWSTSSLTMTDLPLNKYPDEPNPSDEYEWKKWWVKKCFDLKQPLYREQIVWIHDCWKNTAARWTI